MGRQTFRSTFADSYNDIRGSLVLNCVVGHTVADKAAACIAEVQEIPRRVPSSSWSWNGRRAIDLQELLIVSQIAALSAALMKQANRGHDPSAWYGYGAVGELSAVTWRCYL